jgi:uncharacterized protein YbbC (DUF1343 family)
VNPPSESSITSDRVVIGLERLLGDHSDSIQGKRLGLIANPTTVDTHLRHGIDLLHGHPETELMVVFGPEHGLRGSAQDQVKVGDRVDERTGLPVRSLYGPNRRPTTDMVAGLDAIVYDVQDIGSRYYTFIWTMAHAMEACAREGLEMIVADRPNPIGGELVEGAPIEKGFRSFVGLYPIPQRHGMTAGELARLFNEEFDIGCRLTVVPIKGWHRSQWYDQTGLPWILPSPNMPTLDTATVYPGMCLIEGTNLSEGRGTTRPFELMGAPWIEPYRLVSELEKENLPGVRFRAQWFRPTFHKFAGEICSGIQQHVMDRQVYRPLLTGVAILRAVHRLWPDRFQWRPPPYEYETERSAIDILAGNDRLRKQIEKQVPVSEIESSWKEDLAEFDRIRKRYLIY